MSRRREPVLVRYVSPFGTPAWMPRADAERHLAVDDDRWCRFAAVGILSDRQLAVGPPRIEVHS